MFGSSCNYIFVSLIIDPLLSSSSIYCISIPKAGWDATKFYVYVDNAKEQCWALAPLLAPPRHWRELNKVAHVAVAQKLKKNGAVAVARRKMVLIHAISASFSNQILHKNLNKMPILGQLKISGSCNLKH